MNKLLQMMLARGGYMEADDGEGTNNGGGAGGADDADKGNGEGGAGGEDGAGGGEAGSKDGDSGAKKPTDEEARLLKENMKRKEELRKANEELNKLKKQFEGIDPEAVRKLLADQADAETKQLEAKGDYERVKQRMAEEHRKELDRLAAEREAEANARKILESKIVELTIGSSFNGSKFISEETVYTPAKARAIYGQHFEFEDGKIVGYDKPRGAADRTPLVDGFGTPLDFDAAMKKIVESDPEKDFVLRAKQKQGAGSDSKRQEGTKKAVIEGGINKISAGLKNLPMGNSVA